MLAFLPTYVANAPDTPAAVMIITGLCLLGVVVLGIRGRNNGHQ